MLKIISNDLFGCSVLKNNSINEKIIGSFVSLPDDNVVNFNCVDCFRLDNFIFLDKFIKKYKKDIDLVLIGCGNNFYIPSFEILSFFNDLNINYEWQVTRSAVHTNNLLIEDGVSFLGVFNFNAAG
jgi:uncharacterized protein